MAIEIGSLVVDLSANVARLTQDMDQAKRVVSQRMRDVEGVVNSAKTAISALGAGLTGAAFSTFVSRATQSAAALGDMAEATGASVAGLSTLDDIARIGGGNLQTVGSAIQTLNRALQNPNADENRGIGAALKAINLNAEELLRLAPEKRIEEVAKAFSRYADDAGKGNVASALFKRQAQEMIPFLNDVAENLDRVGSLTEQQQRNAEALAKAWNQMSVEASNLGRNIVTNLAPGLTALLKGFNEGGILGGLGSLEGMVMDIKDVEAAWKRAFDELAKYGSEENAPWLARKNYQYWKAAVEAARRAWREANFMGPPEDLRGRPSIPFTGAGGGGGGRSSAGVISQEERQRLQAIAQGYKNLADVIDSEGEEAQRKWLEQFEARRQADESAHLKRMENLTAERELELYYATAGEEEQREWVEAFEKERAAQRLKAEIDLQEETRKEWERTTEDIQRGLTDALMRGFESGKDAAKNFWDALRHMFMTQVLRIPVQYLVQGGMGALGMGAAGGASAGIGNVASMAGSLFGAGGLGGALSAGAGWLTGAASFGQIMGAAGSLIGTGTGAGIGAGLAMGAGSIMPIVGAGLALYSLFSKQGGGPKTRGSGVGNFTGEYASIVSRLGGTPLGMSPYLQYESDPQGTAPTGVYSGLRTASGQLLYERVGRDAGRSEEELATALGEEYSRMLAAAIQATDIAPAIDAIFDSIDPMTSGIEQLNAAIAQAEAWIQQGDTLTAAFRETFLTPIERISIAFGELGLAIPQNEEAFEALVLGLDLNTVAGRETAGTLLSLVPLWRQTQTAAEDAGVALAEAFDPAQTERLVASFRQTFLEPAEQLAIAFGELGIAIPNSEQAFEDLVLGLDYTTQAGRDTAESLLDLVPLWRSAQVVIDEFADDIAELEDSLAFMEGRKSLFDTLIGDLSQPTEEVQGYYDVLAGLGVQFDALGRPTENLIGAFFRTRGEIENLEAALASALGTGERSPIEQLTDLIGTRDSIAGARAGVQSMIFDARLAGMTPAQQVAALRGQESALFAGLAGAADPAAKANELAAVIMRRVGIEAQMADDSVRALLDAQAQQLQAQQDQISEEAKLLELRRDGLRDQIEGAERLRELARGILETAQELDYSDLSPFGYEKQLSSAGSVWASTLAAARAGDPDAMQRISGLSRDYLQEARGYYASSEAYAGIYGEVTGAMRELGLSGGPDVESMQSEMAAIDARLLALDDTLEDLQESVTEQTQVQTALELPALQQLDEALARLEKVYENRITEQTGKVQEQIDELKRIAGNQEAQITQMGTAYAELIRLMTNATTELERLNTAQDVALAA